LPVRGKVLVTVLGAAVAALGASTYFSFQYWENEALEAAKRQALLAAASAQASLESAIRLGRLAPAHQALTTLREEADIAEARVYAADGTVLISADHYEEGTRSPALFIPDARELPRSGMVKVDEGGEGVRAYLPVAIPEPAVLEVALSVAPTMAPMERGARLGMGLLAVSLLAVGVVVVTMFEREVVAPLHRMDVLLANGAGGRRRIRGDLQHLEQSVSELVEKERATEARAEDQHRRLAATEGLAQVGELAAEMAHEFKRPLASIRTAVSVLQQEYELDEGGKEVLAAVNGQLEHLHETMQDLFSLARPVDMAEGSTELADILDEALAEVAAIPGIENVDVHRSYSRDGTRVPGQGRRLRQAFLNILANAVEAMPGGGHLYLATRRDGNTVVVSITDTGPGLEPAEVERVLSPFYSTKPLGTGLGLPLVARIVSAHRGGLAFESRPGKGTTVRISLPVVSQPAPTEPDHG
jgi:signal transduction histidine kinase